MNRNIQSKLLAIIMQRLSVNDAEQILEAVKNNEDAGMRYGIAAQTSARNRIDHLAHKIMHNKDDYDIGVMGTLLNEAMNGREGFTLPDGTITTDPASAAEQWAAAFYQGKDALAMIRPVPEALLQHKSVRCLDETLLACDKVLELGER